MPAAARCPRCSTVLRISDALVGRMVGCTQCGAQFQTAAPKAPAPPRAAPIAVTAHRADTAENQENRLPSTAATERPPRTAIWILAAVLALLLPIAGASLFAVFKWDHSRPNASAKRGKGSG